jgi:aldose 1-epimerase
MAGEPLPTLSSGALSLLLSPGEGGGIARFDFASADGGATPMLRGVAPGEGGILDQASFPLVPFVNRIRGGRFTFRGREVALTPNLAGDPSPLHGHGWLGAWDLMAATESEASLAFDHSAGEWPWAFRAAQHFALDESGLTLTLSCTNESGEPMPCGLGLHPYFPCTPDTVVDAEVDCAWTVDERTLPVERVAAEGRYDLRSRRICGAGLDNGFGGWRGRAHIADPSWPFELHIWSPEARFLHVFAPPHGGFFAMEPVTHANAALNEPEERWPELGLRVLDPGESVALTMRIAVAPRQ